jgi:Zn-finger nucleic acid-binding protein
MLIPSNCPRCNAKLESTVIKDIVADYFAFKCTLCNGYWFSEPAELKQLSKISDISIVEFRKILSAKEQNQPLSCPVCDNQPVMEKVEHKKDRKVIMDVCRQCNGIWLDSGELKAIQTESLGSLFVKMIRWLRQE